MKKDSLKEYRISNTSSLFISLLKNKSIKHDLTNDHKQVKVYLYCDSDLLQLGQTFQLVVDAYPDRKSENY
jgi:hypothetical protein